MRLRERIEPLTSENSITCLHIGWRDAFSMILLSAIGNRIDEPALAAVDVCASDGPSSAQRYRIQEHVAYGRND